MGKNECSHPSYHCMYCDKCHYGDYWEIPDEDKEEYEKYCNSFSDYIKKHNPEIQNIINN